MMKKSLIGATFLVASGGAIVASASDSGTVNNIKGSDTLFNLTNAIFKACPGVAATDVYGGTGSGNGQGAMVAGTQSVAPMSRFLNGGAMCTAAKNPDGGAAIIPPTQSNGLVIGLDGVSIVGSKTTLGPSADGGGAPVVCNRDPNVTCDPTFEATTGAAYNTAIPISGGTYTFNGWRDVLRVLLAGFDHSAGSNYVLRNCNSPVRQALANSWGNFFENQCQASAGEGTTTCTMIRHVFRRDDFSGTTDTIVSLLGLPSIVNPETSVTVTTAAADGGIATSTITQHTGSTPFCNAVVPSFAFPTSSVQPQCLAGDPGSATSSGLVGVDRTYDPTSLCPNGGANCATAPVTVAGCKFERAVYVSTFQDNDSIRRTCAGSGRGGQEEDVCSHSGTLGLVLPIIDVDEPNSGNSAFDPTASNVDRYNAVTPLADGGTALNPCVTGKIAAGPAPDVYDAVTQAKVSAREVTGIVLCPGGDTTNSLGACIEPATSASPTSAACLALKPTIPGTPASNQAVPLVAPVTPSLGDGREFNQHLFSNNAGSAVYQQNSFAARNLPITGAYFRLHANHSLNPVTLRTCQAADMTDQIGCLVEASPCSLGYAGRGAVNNSDQNGNVNTDAIKINAQSPTDLCIQNGFQYPLSRKLYLNSVVGFAAVNANVTSGATTGEELQFTGCETDLAQPGLPTATPAGLMTTNAATDVQQFGFIPIPNGVLLPDGGTLTVNAGEPYCEDFNEVAICNLTGTTNSNACANLPSGLAPATFNFNTTCGNGIREVFEDCDCSDGTDGSPSTDPQCTAAGANGLKNGGAPNICSTTCRLN